MATSYDFKKPKFNTIWLPNCRIQMKNQSHLNAAEVEQNFTVAGKCYMLNYQMALIFLSSRARVSSIHLSRDAMKLHNSSNEY